MFKCFAKSLIKSSHKRTFANGYLRHKTPDAPSWPIISKVTLKYFESVLLLHTLGACIISGWCGLPIIFTLLRPPTLSSLNTQNYLMRRQCDGRNAEFYCCFKIVHWAICGFFDLVDLIMVTSGPSAFYSRLRFSS